MRIVGLVLLVLVVVVALLAFFPPKKRDLAEEKRKRDADEGRRKTATGGYELDHWRTWPVPDTVALLVMLVFSGSLIAEAIPKAHLANLFLVAIGGTAGSYFFARPNKDHLHVLDREKFWQAWTANDAVDGSAQVAPIVNCFIIAAEWARMRTPPDWDAWVVLFLGPVVPCFVAYRWYRAHKKQSAHIRDETLAMEELREDANLLHIRWVLAGVVSLGLSAAVFEVAKCMM